MTYHVKDCMIGFLLVIFFAAMGMTLMTAPGQDPRYTRALGIGLALIFALVIVWLVLLYSRIRYWRTGFIENVKLRNNDHLDRQHNDQLDLLRRILQADPEAVAQLLERHSAGKIPSDEAKMRLLSLLLQ